MSSQPVRRFALEDPAIRPSIEAERRHRKERLAGAFRLFAHFGFDMGLAGHITARDPELTDHFWVNPLGLHFAKIRVSDLLLVNDEGDIVEGDRPVNRAAFAIHSAVHKARPDVVAAAHSHSLYGKAWSSLGHPLDPITQDACSFYGQQGYFDDFTGVVYDTSEGDRIGEALGPHKLVILRNHGFLTAGPSVEACAWWYIAADNAAHAQLLAEAAGKPLLLDHEVATLTSAQVGQVRSAHHSFESNWHWLVEEQPDLLD